MASRISGLAFGVSLIAQRSPLTTGNTSIAVFGGLGSAELYVANAVQRWTLSACTCASVGAGGAVWAGCAVAWLNTATIPPPIPALISAVAAIKATRRPR